MLSLFKLLFLGREKNESDRFPADYIAQGIFKNFLSKTEVGLDKRKEADQLIGDEFESLQQSLANSTDEDRYELIQKTLRRIDQKMADL